MARRRLAFEGRIKIWEDGSEFVAEWGNYYRKSDSVSAAVASLFDELIEIGIILD